jgi:predicted ATP-dependent endonuclease of OLD family
VFGEDPSLFDLKLTIYRARAVWMINKLMITNFKSIRHLAINSTRVNIFIGKPNAGKSNILESLGLLSSLYYLNLRNFIRLESPANLFYDEILDEPIEISFDLMKGEEGPVRYTNTVVFENDRFHFKDGTHTAMNIDYHFAGSFSNAEKLYSSIKFYRFKYSERFDDPSAAFLLPPFGTNLFAVIMAKKELKSLISDMFNTLGLHLGLRSKDRTLEAVKHVENVFYNYPYITISDTFKRMIFYTAVLETNRDSTIVLEEPESKSFPIYTKEIAEWIGQDKNNNQFFISTHNPYFLKSVVEKTPSEDLSVFITYYEDYETKVKKMSEKSLSEMLDIEPFFNLDRLMKD